MGSISLVMGNRYTIGEFLKEIRIRREWTQTTMAEELEVHQTYVSAVEKGQYEKPPLDYLKSIYKQILTKNEKKELMLVLYSSIDDFLEN